MKPIHRYLTICLITTLLTACSTVNKNDPRYQDRHHPHEYSSQLSQTTQLQSNYLARYMLTESERSQIIRQVNDLKPLKTGGFYSPTVNMVSSGLGFAPVALGASLGLSIASSIFEDKGHKEVSGDFLPVQIVGKVIHTESEAHQAMIARTQAKLTTLANLLHRELKCVSGCDQDKGRLYQLAGDFPLPQTLIYKPKHLYVWVDMDYKMRRMSDKKQQLMKKLLGEKLLWESAYINGNRIHFFNPQKFDANGLPKTNSNSGPINAELLDHYQIGRELLRAFYNSPTRFYGAKSAHFLVYNGNYYRFNHRVRTVMTTPPLFDTPVADVVRKTTER